MKKIIIFLIATVLLVSCSQNTGSIQDDMEHTNNITSENKPLEIHIFDDTKDTYFNGVRLDHKLLNYPLTISNNMVYMPFNTTLTKHIGYNSTLDSKSIIAIEALDEKINTFDLNLREKYTDINYSDAHGIGRSILIENEMLTLDNEAFQVDDVIYLPLEEKLISKLSNLTYTNNSTGFYLENSVTPYEYVSLDPNSFEETFDVYQYDLYINDTQCFNTSFSDPMLVYRQTNYIPINAKVGRMLGFDTYRDQNGNIILEKYNDIVNSGYGDSKVTFNELNFIGNKIIYDGTEYDLSLDIIERNGTIYLPLNQSLFNILPQLNIKQNPTSIQIQINEEIIETNPAMPSLIKKEKRIYVPRDDVNGLDYFITIPKGLNPDEKNIIVLDFDKLHSGFIDPQLYYEQSEDDRRSIHPRHWLLNNDQPQFISLSIVMVEDDAHGNAAQLDDIFYTDDPFYNRIDLKVQKIIEEAVITIEEQNIKVYDKVLIEGFSSTGISAVKFAILMPDKILAIIAGSPGVVNLLTNDFEAQNYEWPYGLKNFVDMTGYSFDKEAFNKIPKFLYIGSLDNQASFFADEPGKGINQTAQHYINIGTYDPERLYNLINGYKKDNYQGFYFKMFNNTIHERPYSFVNNLALSFKENQGPSEWVNFTSTNEEVEEMLLNSEERIVHMYMNHDYHDRRSYQVNHDTIYDLNEVVIIKDVNLKQVICDTILKSTDETIRYKDVYQIRTLYGGGRNIEDLTGIEYLNNLQVLDLEDNNIKSITALGKLNKLTSINLNKNKHIDNFIALSNLSNLVTLKLAGTRIENVDFLDNLNRITVLDLQRNKLHIEDLQVLLKYHDLVYLNIDGNYGANKSFLENFKYLNFK